MIAWADLVQIHALMPEPIEVRYWLYYDTHSGEPRVYSMEHLAGDRIEVDKHTYLLASMQVRVRNQKLVWISVTDSEKLRPGHQGTGCHPHDVCVIDVHSRVRWSKKIYHEKVS